MKLEDIVVSKPEEYKALKKDIKKRGVLVPVEVDEKGDVLDGYNRVAIAKKLGLSFKTITRHFKTEEEKHEHVIKLNLARRHLDPLRWGMAFKQLLKVKGVRRGTGTRNDKLTGATVAQVATETGVSPRTARHRVAMAETYSNLPASEKQAVDEGKTTVVRNKNEVQYAQM
ncbi:MAG: ParB N-terminal domain-containing protein [Candidatus Yonathbacteria bacterium]|nr:ParB N-terminal domain-containing protein [Candidatus Yonathbacteria bacterium]